MPDKVRSLIKNSRIEDYPIDQEEVRIKKLIIDSYDDWIVRAYCRSRFHIINSNFLETIEQHLPAEAVVLDIGCGFGLFSLYFAMRQGKRRVYGFDINERRINLANHTASKLGVQNAYFRVGDATSYRFDDKFDAVIALDILHHIDRSNGDRILESAYTHLNPEGVLLIKDVNVRPYWKMLFTYAMDKAMDIRRSVYYRHVKTWREKITEVGFEPIYIYYLNDYLPYPHILLVCHKS